MTFEVCAPARLADAIQAAWPHGTRAGDRDLDGAGLAFRIDPAGQGFELHGPDGPIWSGGREDALLYELHRELQLAVALHAPDRLFIHAGAVAWRGRGIVFPASSRAGKTTLTSALLAAGCEYGSDEFALLDSAGRLHPYPRPLRVRGADDEARSVGAAELGARPFTDALPVGLVLLTSHVEGATFSPLATSAGHAALGLLAHTVAARRTPERALDWITRALAGARAFSGPRGAAAEAARHVLALAC